MTHKANLVLTPADCHKAPWRDDGGAIHYPSGYVSRDHRCLQLILLACGFAVIWVTIFKIITHATVRESKPAGLYESER